jgi:hypothetical protein
MHSVLLVIERPQDDAEPVKRISYQQQLSPRLEGLIQKYKSIEVLGEGVLMIKVDELAGLTAAFAACEQTGHPYKCIFFGDSPQWVHSKI